MWDTLALIVAVSVIFLVWLPYLAARCPLYHWQSYRFVLSAVLADRTLPRRARLRMLSYLASDLVLSLLHGLLWWVDELLLTGAIKRENIARPVFVVSQPRSGSTFLHRLLADDDEKFFSVTYLEWRWPYVCVWRVIDLLNLRERLNRRNYWGEGSTTAKTASMMHPHLYGDHEEHGVFLEEKFYRHYFVFRRFPLASVLWRVTDYDALSIPDRVRMLCAFINVVRKVSYYRGRGRTWLTKENESTVFYQWLIALFPDARLLFLVRDHVPMLSSYVTLSCASTHAKTGLNLCDLKSSWWRANVEFRRREARAFCLLYKQTRADGRVVEALNYGTLVGDVVGTVRRVYDFLGLGLSAARERELVLLNGEQRRRVRGYVTSALLDGDADGFETLAEFHELTLQ